MGAEGNRHVLSPLRRASGQTEGIWFTVLPPSLIPTSYLQRDRCSSPPGRMVSSCIVKGTRHREIKDHNQDAQGVSNSVQELTALVCPHRVSNLQQRAVRNSLFGANPCNFQSNSPVACLPASHKWNHSTESTTALRACFLYSIQHTLARAAWCIPTLW